MGSREPRETRTTLGALALVVVLVAGFALLPRAIGRREDGIVGRQAPEFVLSLVANGEALGGDGARLAMSALRGRAVVLDFWATWCPPCRAEAPIVDELSRRWRDRDVVVVGVDTDTVGQGDPGEFARRHHLSYPIVHDVLGEASRSYGIENLPTVVVVSRTGRIVSVRTGMTDATELDRLIRRAL